MTKPIFKIRRLTFDGCLKRHDGHDGEQNGAETEFQKREKYTDYDCCFGRLPRRFYVDFVTWSR